MNLFEDCSTWASKATENWSITSGGSISCGALGFVEAKVINFEHLEMRRSKSFLLVSGGVGARLEAKLKAGELARLLDTGGKARHATNALGNPNSQSSESATIHNPFCLNDLYMAVAVGASTGVDGGVIGTSVSGVLFVGLPGNLFTLSGAQVELILGAGINIVSWQGGVLFGVVKAKHRMPSKHDLATRLNPMRPHPGKI